MNIPCNSAFYIVVFFLVQFSVNQLFVICRVCHKPDGKYWLSLFFHNYLIKFTKCHSWEWRLHQHCKHLLWFYIIYVEYSSLKYLSYEFKKKTKSPTWKKCRCIHYGDDDYYYLCVCVTYTYWLGWQVLRILVGFGENREWWLKKTVNCHYLFELSM